MPSGSCWEAYQSGWEASGGPRRSAGRRRRRATAHHRNMTWRVIRILSSDKMLGRVAARAYSRGIRFDIGMEDQKHCDAREFVSMVVQA